MNELGKSIRIARESRRLDQTRLATRLRKSQSYVSYIELGKVTPPAKDLVRIARALRVAALTLFRAHPDYSVWSKVLGGK